MASGPALFSTVVDLCNKRARHEMGGIDLALQADALGFLGEQQAGRLGEAGGGRRLDRLERAGADAAGADQMGASPAGAGRRRRRAPRRRRRSPPGRPRRRGRPPASAPAGRSVRSSPLAGSLGEQLLDPGVVAGVAQRLVVEMADLALEGGRQVGRAAGGEVLLVGDAVDHDRGPLGERRPGGPLAVAQDGGRLDVLGGDPAGAPGEAVEVRRPGAWWSGRRRASRSARRRRRRLLAEALVEAVAEHVDVARARARSGGGSRARRPRRSPGSPRSPRRAR